jgi:hypothetical protein
MAEHKSETPVRLHGILAEFHEPHELLAAAEKAYAAGYRKMDAYSPIPVEGLSEALGFHHTRLPLLVLGGGIVGCLSGYAMEYWMSAIDFPLNIGGRPLNSWPMFVPIMFELTILFASLTAVFGMLALNGLPMPYHPVFNAEAFGMASTDRFFLCIEARDDQFDLEATPRFLQEMNPSSVAFVEP